MKCPEVTRLYKFYAYNANSLAVLLDKAVWFSKPGTLNDPFDIDIDFHMPTISPCELKYMICAAKGMPGLSKAQLEQYEALERDIPNLSCDDYEGIRRCFNTDSNNRFREDRKNWGVFCMSATNENILMWSHYADHHKGFCVEFLRSPENCLGNSDKTRPVNYSCQYPKPNPFDEKSYDEVFFTKAIGWKHEEEWRILDDEGDVARPLPGDITAIIFGLQMSAVHRRTVINILSSNPSILLRTAGKVPNEFRLKIVDCKPEDLFE